MKKKAYYSVQLLCCGVWEELFSFPADPEVNISDPASIPLEADRSYTADDKRHYIKAALDGRDDVRIVFGSRKSLQSTIGQREYSSSRG